MRISKDCPVSPDIQFSSTVSVANGINNVTSVAIILAFYIVFEAIGTSNYMVRINKFAELAF